MSLRDEFVRYCTTHPNAPAVRSATTQGGEFHSRHAVLLRALSAAARLQSCGVGRGDTVILSLQTVPDFLPWFWGAQLLGAAPVPTEPLVSKRRKIAQLEHLHKLSALTRPKAVIASANASLCEADVHGIAFLDAADDLRTAPLESIPSTTISPQDVALIQFSSGSTGNPKGCLLRQGAVCLNARAWVQTFDYRAGEATLNWMPLFHDFGLMVGIIAPVFGDMTTILLQTEAFVSSPATWLRRLGGVGPVHTAAPASALALVRARLALRGAQVFALEDVRSLICAAEPIYPNITEDFLELTKPFGFRPTSFFAAYGMSETTVLASGKRGLHVDHVIDCGPEIGAAVAATHSGNHTSSFVNVGRAVAGGEFRIVDDSRRALPDRHIGHLQLRSPCLMDGYFSNPLQTDEVLRDGWYSTGDIGYLIDGEFYFVARSRDIICVAGRKHAPADIDLAVSEKLGVPPSRVACFGVVNELGTESIVVVVETRSPDEEGLKQSARMACFERSGVMPAKVMTCPVGTIPKTTSGKVRRAKLRQMITDMSVTAPQEITNSCTL
jgi:fatty-acyl-CoA synthase